MEDSKKSILQNKTNRYSVQIWFQYWLDICPLYGKLCFKNIKYCVDINLGMNIEENNYVNLVRKLNQILFILVYVHNASTKCISLLKQKQTECKHIVPIVGQISKAILYCFYQCIYHVPI